MRIALIALHFSEYAARLALALAEKHRVLLILRKDNAEAELSPALRKALEEKVELHQIEHRMLKQPGVLGAATRLVALVRAFQPDVVHGQEYLSDYAAWGSLCLGQLFPMVLTVHDHVTHTGADSRLPWRKRVYRRLLRKGADRILVHGERIRADMAADPTYRESRIFSVMHGVLGNAGGSGTKVRAEPATLLFFGRIEAYKGLGVLLKALEILGSETIPDLRLIIAGRGSDLEPYRARIGADPRIELMERYIAVEEVPALFARSTAAVLPYTDATQSGVAALAFAYGRPVIASNTGALPEVVREGETGLLVSPGDPVALAEAIKRLFMDKGLWQRLARGASALAAGDLSWSRIAECTVSVYAALLQDRVVTHGN